MSPTMVCKGNIWLLILPPSHRISGFQKCLSKTAISKISACPDLATYLLQIPIPATYNSLVCQKGQFTLQLCHRRWFVRKIFGYYTPKVKIEKSL